MIAGGDVAAEVENTKRQVEAGFTSFKVEAGIKGPERHLEQFTAVRAAAESTAKISADANQGYSMDEAITFAQGAAQAGLDFMEQLVMADDLDGMAACARESSVPLGADEGLHSMRDIRDRHAHCAVAGGSRMLPRLV